MSMSFYGGRRGASINIVKAYCDFNALKNDFAKDTCEVPVDACAIILDSANLVEHGKLYRRQPNKEPFFIGNIAGPAGPKIEADEYVRGEKEINSEIIEELKRIYNPAPSIIPFVVAYGRDVNKTKFFAYINTKQGATSPDWQYLGEYNSNNLSITTNDIKTDTYEISGINSIRLYLTEV